MYMKKWSWPIVACGTKCAATWRWTRDWLTPSRHIIRDIMQVHLDKPLNVSRCISMYRIRGRKAGVSFHATWSRGVSRRFSEVYRTVYLSRAGSNLSTLWTTADPVRRAKSIRLPTVRWGSTWHTALFSWSSSPSPRTERWRTGRWRRWSRPSSSRPSSSWSSCSATWYCAYARCWSRSPRTWTSNPGRVSGQWRDTTSPSIPHQRRLSLSACCCSSAWPSPSAGVHWAMPGPSGPTFAYHS